MVGFPPKRSNLIKPEFTKMHCLDLFQKPFFCITDFYTSTDLNEKKQ